MSKGNGDMSLKRCSTSNTFDPNQFPSMGLKRCSTSDTFDQNLTVVQFPSMGKRDMSLKRCSTSTDVEAADAVDKVTESLQNAKRDLDNLLTKLNPKKQRKRKKKFNKKLGMKKLRNSMEEMAETMKILDGTLVKIQKKKKKKKKEDVEAINYECCYDDQDWKGNNKKTLFVQGFDTCLSKDEIKSIIRTRLRMCGEIKRIFVPIECKTGVSIGYAFVDVENTESALYLSGTGIGRDKIDVMLAKYRPEYSTDFIRGCPRCSINLPFCCEHGDGTGCALDKDLINSLFRNTSA